jgi:hypothetical protein
MLALKLIRILAQLVIMTIFLNSCGGKIPGVPGADASKFPDDPEKRVQKNLSEGRGFKLMDAVGNKNKGGVFDFASSNELWRASLDVIDFMPLTSVNYSGGIIITDWYSTEKNPDESIKVSIRFLTNEIRSDSLNVKVFNRKCSNNLLNCKIVETDGVITSEIKKEILKKATLYKNENKNKKNK